MKYKFYGAILLAMVLCGCAPQGVRTVDTFDGEQFVAMSRAMRPVMLQKHMVDSNGDWYSPLLSYPPDQAGKTLLDRLSPAFRFPDSRIPVPQTFRAMLTKDARVVIKGHKAVVEQGLSIITLELVAVTDWNNDGKGDWLVLCRTAFSDTPRKFREYYLTITDLESPVLIPQVQMVIDHVYGKVSVVSNASVGELAENVSDEFMQGQTTVTQVPDSTAVQKKKEEGSSLKKTSLSR